MRQLIVVSMLLAQYASEPPTAPEGALLKMHRTRCFGTCADYSVTIFEDRHFVFAGRTYVLDKGEHAGWLSPSDFAAIHDALESVQFDKLPERFEAWATDLPWTGICRGGRNPRCTLYEAGDSKVPQGLFDLAARIDESTRSDQWISGPDAGVGLTDHGRHLGGAFGMTTIVSRSGSCDIATPPTAVQTAVAQIRSGELDQARERLRQLAQSEPVAAFALACAELAAGDPRAAEDAFHLLQGAATDWTELPALEALIAAREAGQPWLAAAARAVSSSASNLNQHIQYLETWRKGAPDAGPPATPQAFLAQAAAFPASPEMRANLLGIAKALPGRSGEWTTRPVRLVGLALLLPGAQMEASTGPLLDTLVDDLVTDDPTDLWLGILRIAGARPTTPFDDRDAWLFEQLVQTAKFRSHVPEIYAAIKAALLADKDGAATLSAYAAAERFSMQLAGSMVLIGRGGKTLRDGDPAVKQRLAQVLDALARQMADPPRQSDRIPALALTRLSRRLQGRDAERTPFQSLTADPAFILKAKALGLAQWPIPPLTDAIIDGLAFDESQLLARLSAAP